MREPSGALMNREPYDCKHQNQSLRKRNPVPIQLRIEFNSTCLNIPACLDSLLY